MFTDHMMLLNGTFPNTLCRNVKVDCSPGRYVLFRLTKKKYYVSSVVEVGENQVILKAARKYGEHQGKITCWPLNNNM